ncbi:uncharacterized protein LOC123500338 [Portunus trituberculatus]|uniref:uncharacterized protein LOC123500338 n=1 Tax=Portunus trituberculatus TaxID=210409 RepID=UPI001E1CCAB7|nr:uncharacterized protein LOC123500338 [Portunus trituberculatus]
MQTILVENTAPSTHPMKSTPCTNTPRSTVGPITSIIMKHFDKDMVLFLASLGNGTIGNLQNVVSSVIFCYSTKLHHLHNHSCSGCFEMGHHSRQWLQCISVPRPAPPHGDAGTEIHQHTTHTFIPPPPPSPSPHSLDAGVVRCGLKYKQQCHSPPYNYTTPRHATPRHATPRHATLRHTTLRHTTLRHTTLRHTTLRPPCFATPRFATQRHTTWLRIAPESLE